jgi:hypothetical protein
MLNAEFRMPTTANLYCLLQHSSFIILNFKMPSFTSTELIGFLDEALSPTEMARIEQALRADPALLRQLAAINARRDAGIHSVGEIWRRHRLTCPTREQLGSFLLGVLDEGQAGYIRLHLDAVECRYCRANVDDLERQKAEQAAAADGRRRKYFQSSAGHLAKSRA